MSRAGSCVASRLGRLVAVLVLLTACDNFRLPAPPAQAANDTALVAAPVKSAKPARKSPAAAVDPETAARRFEDVRRGLRRLVVSEETYYAENGIYTQVNADIIDASGAYQNRTFVLTVGGEGYCIGDIA